MARLNMHTPRPPARSSGHRSRAPSELPDSPPSSGAGTPVASSPSSLYSSNKENQTGPRMARNGKQRAPADSQTADTEGHASKRRRLQERDANAGRGAAVNPDDIYNPDQKMEVRRELRDGMRQNTRELFDSREKYLESNTEIVKLLKDQNECFKKVRQTVDATIDSRFLVDLSDVILAKNTREILGNESIALNMDEFVAKCITFMKFGGPAGSEDDYEPTATQARRRQDPDGREDEDNGDALAWEFLGEKACYPHIRRPPAPSFLLGPLSVQKKQRAPTQRIGRLRRDAQAVATKPQELKAEDLERNEKSTLTHMCRKIRERLDEHNRNSIRQAEVSFDEEITSELEEDEAKQLGIAILKRHRLADNYEVPLFDFAVHPHSFGQTVENLFYVSFLIKDGYVRLNYDSNGLPTLRVLSTEEIQTMHDNCEGSKRRQAIFSLSYETWRKLKTAYDIKEPLIPHREEETQQVGAAGWYG